MDPLTLGLLGASAVPSIIGLFTGSDANQYANQAIQQLIQAKIPDPEQQKIALQRYQSTGQLTPELEQAIKQDPSSFKQIVQNQQYSQAQNKALGQLQSLGEEGGLSLSDKAGLQEALATNANKDRANRTAIADDMARRGQTGSGAALQAQLQGAQSAGDRDAQGRLKALGDAHDRELQSISQAGTLAGNLQSQDYKRQSDLASAQDRINQFNAQNAQAVQQRNVAASNNAAETNLQNSQKISNANTDLTNKEDQYNKGLYQKQFENELQQGGALSSAYGGAANQANQAAAQKRQAFGALGSSVGQIGSTIQNQNNWDNWLASAKNKNKPIAVDNDQWSSGGGLA